MKFEVSQYNIVGSSSQFIVALCHYRMTPATFRKKIKYKMTHGCSVHEVSLSLACLFSTIYAEIVACNGVFAQSAYRGVGTTITCNYPGNNLANNISLCKDNNPHECKEMSRTSTTIQAGLSVAMSQVSLADQGVYWCTFRKNDYQGAYQKVVLSVKGEIRQKESKGKYRAI